LERRIREAGKPFLRLYFEEHSGEAGLITRLEAFTDLLKYRSRAC
jgi:predicted nucleotide-binding protein (sugar kinase/HSP70/actin superfamily)